MSPLRVHRALGRIRHAAILPAVVLALGLAIFAHHGMPAADHGDHGMDMGTVMELCLGVFTAVGAAVVAVCIGVLRLGRWRPPARPLPAAATVVARLPDVRARAGPVFLCVHRC